MKQQRVRRVDEPEDIAELGWKGGFGMGALVNWCCHDRI